jgi:hypothetical protein
MKHAVERTQSGLSDEGKKESPDSSFGNRSIDDKHLHLDRSGILSYYLPTGLIRWKERMVGVDSQNGRFYILGSKKVINVSYLFQAPAQRIF